VNYDKYVVSESAVIGLV